MSENAQRVYGDTIVRHGGYAHLGDVNLTGGIHIHQYRVQEGHVVLSDGSYVLQPNIAYQRILETALGASVINTSLSISPLQLETILGEVFTGVRDPVTDLRLSYILRQRRIRTGCYLPIPESARVQLQQWVEKPVSSAVVLEGRHTQRSLIQDASTEVVKIVQEANIPILYLVDIRGSGRSQCLSTTEILDCLILQAIKHNVSLNNEQSLSAILGRVRVADSFEARVGVLASALEGLSEVYIVVNFFTWQSSPPESSMLDMCDALLRQLAIRSNRTKVKIILAGYSGEPETQHRFDEESPQFVSSICCSVAKVYSTRRKRKPTSQLGRLSKIMKLR